MGTPFASHAVGLQVYARSLVVVVIVFPYGFFRSAASPGAVGFWSVQ